VPVVLPAVGGRPVRSFIAIALADPARSEVDAYLVDLRRTISDVAWTPPENLHLTLKFLGDVMPARLESLAARLAEIAAAQPPFALTVAGVGAFPSFRRPRILWIGAAAPAVGPLAATVDRACAAEGFAPETRAFHPHLTLGRVRQGRGAGRGRRGRRAAPGENRDRPADPTSALAALDQERERSFGVSPADALVLFQSELGSIAARHIPLARWPFAGDRGGG
jgi:2'-5' RNA ligase